MQEAPLDLSFVRAEEEPEDGTILRERDGESSEDEWPTEARGVKRQPSTNIESMRQNSTSEESRVERPEMEPPRFSWHGTRLSRHREEVGGQGRGSDLVSRREVMALIAFIDERVPTRCLRKILTNNRCKEARRNTHAYSKNDSITQRGLDDARAKEWGEMWEHFNALYIVRGKELE